MSLPKVSIVVTAYLEKSKPYLDVCIRSIHNLNYPKELIDTVLVTPTWFKPEYENVKVIHPCFGAYHNPIGVNYGFEHSNQDSKFVLMVNDDVILTRNSLMKMVLLAGDNRAIIGAISNCDQAGFFDADLPLGINSRQYRLEDLGDKVHAMLNADLPTGPIRMIRPHTLYLYANLYPRSVWREVKNGTTPGAIGFDTNYKTGQDDIDYCLRAQRQGVILGIATDSLIWHASGTSADVTMKGIGSEEREHGPAYFKNKWGFF